MNGNGFASGEGQVHARSSSSSSSSSSSDRAELALKQQLPAAAKRDAATMHNGHLKQEPASLLRKAALSNGASASTASSSKVQLSVPQSTAEEAESNGIARPTAADTVNIKSPLLHTTPLFQPQTVRSWEKSRKIDVDNERSEPLPSREELEEQLRPEEEGLVPLNAIAGRVVHYAWQLFANQAEINSSISPLERRKRIYDDAHEARKQLIKLLVLVQWSKSAPELHTARNLIALINDHFVQTDAAVGSLEETRITLNNARLRRYDLATSIEVLSNGAPQRVPPALREVTLTPKAYSDREAVQLVQELDDVLRHRLASREALPLRMSNYTISDGRACFRATDLFEADLTLSGDEEFDRWWLLRVKFDFNITGQGADKFNKQPRGREREHLLALADSELAPRSAAAAISEQEEGEIAEPVDGRTQTPTEVTSDMSGSLERRDAPLVRLYNLLQTQSLRHRLTILHWQASQLSRLGWANRLSVTLQGQAGLRIAYWQKSDVGSLSRTAAKQIWDPSLPGEIHMYLKDEEEGIGSTKILANFFQTEHCRQDKPRRQNLQAEWSLNSVAAHFVDSLAITIDHRALDAEQILKSLTDRHAVAIIKAFQGRIAGSSLARTSTLRVVSDERQSHALYIGLHHTIEVKLAVDATSGKLSLHGFERGETASGHTLAFEQLTSSSRHEHISRASRRVEEEPHNIVGILQRLRNVILLADLEMQCRLAGLGCSRSLPLRHTDLVQIGAQTGTLLYVAIPQCATFYLALHIGQEKLTAAILCAGTFFEGATTSMRVVGQTRLDWQFIVRGKYGNDRLGKRKRQSAPIDLPSSDDPLLMTEEELRQLHEYCVAFICYQRIEQQVRQRGIECFFAERYTDEVETKASGTSTKSSAAPRAAVVPLLCLRSSAIFGHPKNHGIGQNIVLRLRDWSDPAQCRVVFTVQAPLTTGSRVASERISDGFDEVIYEKKSGRLIFVVADISNCIERLISLWRRIEKVLDLVKTLARRPKPVEGNAYVLDAFDLINVRFTYDDALLARVGWVQQASAGRQGFFTLEFGSSLANKINPHALLCGALQIELNRGHDQRPAFWPRFIALLQATLPLAKATYMLPTQSEEDVDCPEVEVRSATWLRLLFLQQYALDVRLTKGNRVLLQDAAQTKSKQLPRKEQSLDEVPSDPDQADEFSIDALVGADGLVSSKDDGRDTTMAAEENATLPSFTHLKPIPSFEDIARELLVIAQQPSDLLEGASQDLPPLAFSNAVLVPWHALRVEELITAAISRIRARLSGLAD